MKLNAIINYDGKMDKEVIDICNALNSLSGVKTLESCSGHGKDCVSIFFRVTDIVGLFFLARCIDGRYWTYGNYWDITLTIADRMNKNTVPLLYVLRSKTKGNEAYKQLSDLIENMNHHLNHKAFIGGYGIDVSTFKHK